jgi:hypothetical protein
MGLSNSNHALASLDYNSQRAAREVPSGKRTQASGHVKNSNSSIYKPTQIVHAAPHGGQSEMFTLVMNNTTNQKAVYQMPAHLHGNFATNKPGVNKPTSRNGLQSFDALKIPKKRGRQASALVG